MLLLTHSPDNVDKELNPHVLERVWYQGQPLIECEVHSVSSVVVLHDAVLDGFEKKIADRLIVGC